MLTTIRQLLMEHFDLSFLWLFCLNIYRSNKVLEKSVSTNDINSQTDPLRLIYEKIRNYSEKMKDGKKKWTFLLEIKELLICCFDEFLEAYMSTK